VLDTRIEPTLPREMRGPGVSTPGRLAMRSRRCASLGYGRLSCAVFVFPLLVLTSPGLAGEPPSDSGPGGVLGQPVVLPPSGEPVPRTLLDRLGPAPLSGEPVNGFPNWQERVMHEWVNRARVDPQADLAGCPAGNCLENINNCYAPQSPMIWNASAGH